MRNIEITRDHDLSLVQAKALAKQWITQGESDWQLNCDYQEQSDGIALVNFNRSGINGKLTVTDQQFLLSLQLGFLLRPYHQRITSAIEKNLNHFLETFKA